MTIINDLSALPVIPAGSALTMGDFDGIHTGHHVLIEATKQRAMAHNLTSVLVTYEPSPKKLLKKLAFDSRLTTYGEKCEILAGTGLDYVVFYPMSTEVLKLSARSFLRNFLLGHLKMRELIMGGDHRFGHNRRGTASYLEAAAHRYGFHATIIAEQKTLTERTSSSRIRSALLSADIQMVSDILGRPYSVSGEVIRGEARGRTIGFPTANLKLDPEKLLPGNGVYYGHVTLKDGGRFRAVGNLGYKPTVGAHALGFEIHILDLQDRDLYGTQITFEFHGRIRAETKFGSLEALKAQITADIDFARKKLS